jgi:hypothetical protein
MVEQVVVEKLDQMEERLQILVELQTQVVDLGVLLVVVYQLQVVVQADQE